jgi:hypothetical protein
MARQRTSKTTKTTGGRGSKEAIEKRRAARQLNALLTSGGPPGSKLDGRTEKRRKRLINELKQGRRGAPLKPIDFLTHVNELLELGETAASLKQAGVKPRRAEESEAIAEAAHHVQAAYGFRAEAWKFLGVSVQTNEEKAAGRRPRRRKKGPG